jgi:hypothetical protein
VALACGVRTGQADLSLRTSNVKTIDADPVVAGFPAFTGHTRASIHALSGIGVAPEARFAGDVTTRVGDAIASTPDLPTGLAERARELRRAAGRNTTSLVTRIVRTRTRGRIVDDTIAVVVEAVADFGGGSPVTDATDRRAKAFGPTVLTLSGVADLLESFVGALESHIGQNRLVDESVAIVVDTVADLGRTRSSAVTDE